MIRRILLADDDADDRMLFEEVFADLPADQYQLYSVSNGEEVVAFLKSINNPAHLPDLVILDQNMPLMSGKETLEFIRSEEAFRQIPVIIYSTYNDKTFIKECETLGVIAVVSKPDSYEGYIKMINSFLKYTSKPVS
jgi:CheY-like chemotaxis protein